MKKFLILPALLLMGQLQAAASPSSTKQKVIDSTVAVVKVGVGLGLIASMVWHNRRHMPKVEREAQLRFFDAQCKAHPVVTGIGQILVGSTGLTLLGWGLGDIINLIKYGRS